MPVVNAKEMLTSARKGHYAVGHFNLNNMESVRAFLLAAEEVRSPIILGVSGGTAKYMGGYKTIADMVRDFMDFLKITVPVCTHVDHGTYEEALAAIEGGFSSVMFDGSKYAFEENIEKTRRVVELAHATANTRKTGRACALTCWPPFRKRPGICPWYSTAAAASRTRWCARPSHWASPR